MDKNQVLLQRSLTGAIFSLVVIGLIFSGKYGALGLGFFIAGFSSYEYVRMIFPNDKQKLLLAIAITLASIFLIVMVDPKSATYFYLTILSCLMLTLGILNMFYPFIRQEKVYPFVSIFYFGLPLGLFISHIYHTEPYLPYFWMSIIALIWISDSFAYLFGSRMGKHKLLERISPKKTWEGFLGAGICVLPAAYMMGNYLFTEPQNMYANTFQSENTSGIFWMLMAGLAWIVGTAGDLVESSIKRTFGIKDSGKLLPGHGGILDRFDSFIYILPFVLLLLLYFTN